MECRRYIIPLAEANGEEYILKIPLGLWLSLLLSALADGLEKSPQDIHHLPFFIR
jgi:hypothetical protein